MLNLKTRRLQCQESKRVSKNGTFVGKDMPPCPKRMEPGQGCTETLRRIIRSRNRISLLGVIVRRNDENLAQLLNEERC